ncbi:MAG TPA: hypothetical protein ENH91_15380 [Leeuwenhoekiella sp.]|nr:hypothetical protein [Leeuwenhoekiella sp.]
MKVLFTTIIMIIMISCGQQAARNNNLALNPEVEKLALPSQRVAEDWPAYRNLENNLKIICSTNAFNATSFRKSMMRNVEGMKKDIPNPFNTKGVKTSISGLERQVSSFYNEVQDDELDKRIVEQHVEEIMNAFAGLNHTLNYTLAQRD